MYYIFSVDLVHTCIECTTLLAAMLLAYTYSICTVFSPAYMYFRHVGPTSLQFRLSFDVGMGRIQRFWCGYTLHPNHALPSSFEICLGRTLMYLQQIVQHTKGYSASWCSSYKVYRVLLHTNKLAKALIVKPPTASQTLTGSITPWPSIFNRIHLYIYMYIHCTYIEMS